MWQRPHAIDVGATEDVAIPKSWRSAMPGVETVATLAMSANTGPQIPGWCTAIGEMQGPEIEVVCGGINTKKPTHVGVWRQGNLLHFGFEPAPAQLNSTGRKLLLNGIDYISRFVSDRPIVRVRTFFDPKGPGPSIPWLERFLTDETASAEALADLFAEPWRAKIVALDDDAARAFVNTRRGMLRTEGRKFAFDEVALRFGFDLRKPNSLSQLTNCLRGEHGDAAKASLLRLLPAGPGEGTSSENWRNWLRARQRYLCHDPFQLVFRIDPVAQWRRQPSTELRDLARADGSSERDAEAMALAAKVVAFHGGARTLDDLHTFACRLGDTHYFWDRRQGVMRSENHTAAVDPVKAFVKARATPWKVIIFDTFADRDILMGGGPAPRPRVSGRGMFGTIVERVFLPLLLLEPETSVTLLPNGDDGNHRLAVKIAGRGIDPRKTHVLQIEPSGKVVAYDLGPSAASRTNVMKITATTQVGPLLLPTSFSLGGRRVREYIYLDASWNPTSPKGVETSAELLLGDK